MATKNKTANTANAEAPKTKTESKATKKVKFKQLYIGTYGYFMPNQIATVPALFADSAIASGVAVVTD